MLVYFSLGTNLGAKDQNLRQAVEKIEERIGRVCSLSSFFQTEPWGFESPNSFLNAAVSVETDLSPEKLLLQTQLIEKEMGRMHKSKNGRYADRIIDIDLLLYGNQEIHTESLEVPHPLMYKRLFVMQPLCEIAAGTTHPVLHKTIRELLDELLKES